MDESLQRTVIAAAHKASGLRSETGFWPLIGSSFVDLADFDSWSLENDSTIDQLVALASQPDLRAAAIHVAWYGACAASSMATIENNVEIYPSTDVVGRCIDAYPAEAADTGAQFRWELDTAASFGQHRRVLRLLRNWHDQNMPPEYLEIAVRMLYLLTTPEFEVTPLLSGSWDPSLQLGPAKMRDYYSLYSTIAWASTFSIPALRNPPKMDRRASLSEIVDRQKVRELCQWLDLAEDSGFIKAPVVSAISAWAHYATGLLHDRPDDLQTAGHLFEQLPFPGGDPQSVASVNWRRLRAATIAFEDAESLRDALRTANQWAVDDGSPDKQGWRKVAQLTIRMGELDHAVPALLKAIEGEEGELDWREKLIVELGLERLAGTSVERAINASAANSPFRQQGESLTEWLLPFYSHLSPEARQRFWTGLFALTSREFLRNTDHSAFEVAGQSIGESLAFELKAAIFNPFFAEHADLQLPADGAWSEIRTGRGSLGAAVNTLLQTRGVTNSRAATLLSAWLYKNLPHLMDELKKNREILEKATRLRNRAAHNSFTATDVRKLLDAVCTIFTAIHKQSLRP